MRKLQILAGLAIIMLVGTARAENEEQGRFEKVVSRLVKAINEGNNAGIRADFGQVMLTSFPEEQSKVFFKDLVNQFGKIEKLGEAKYSPPNQAVIPAHFGKIILDIKVVLDGEDKIIGLWFVPHTPDVEVSEKNETKLSLPLKGGCLVAWGGDTKEVNVHHDTVNQRFAFDFVGVGEDGKTHKGDGLVNEDYFIFGREILSPAKGVVTDVIRGVRDNVPGSMNPFSALGNAVFIQHSEGEVSVLAHFKHGSTKVKVGEKVERGQVIGLCGNSGNSSEPHLHYHLQNTPVIQDGIGIKCYFDKVVLIEDNKKETKMNYSPVRGEVISGE